ncbi:hypothetical protein [Burkholderia cepacia]|uniref:hypothetical protein n=1 Tax=Burkholderia cepacia TaxID=292 RepID=UPI0011BE2433|nr:hypothetical protein [Burkholderia cepacia]
MASLPESAIRATGCNENLTNCSMRICRATIPRWRTGTCRTPVTSHCATTRGRLRASYSATSETFATVNCFGEDDGTTPFDGDKASGVGGRDMSIPVRGRHTGIETIRIDVPVGPAQAEPNHPIANLNVETGRTHEAQE